MYLEECLKPFLPAGDHQTNHHHQFKETIKMPSFFANHRKQVDVFISTEVSFNSKKLGI